MDATTSNYHTKELDLHFGKLTFRQLEREAEAAELLQDKLDFVIEVVGRMSANGQVIHVNNKPTFVDVVGEVEVHECLKRWRRTTESEKHHRWFEQPKRCDESSLPFITLLDLNVVISPLYVELGKERELAKVIDEVRDKG